MKMKTYPRMTLIKVLLILLPAVQLATGCRKNNTAANDNTDSRTPETELTNGWGNGVNLQPSYYNSGNVNFGWSLMKANPKIKTVRIEIEPTVSITTVKSWISQAKSNGYNIICTYHKASVLGSD